MFKIPTCEYIVRNSIMSACQRCGTVLVPRSTICQSCGFPMSTPIMPVIAPRGTQRALVGSTPAYQALSGFFIIIMGFIFLSLFSGTPLSAFPLIFILFGAVLLILGLMGKPLMTQQVMFQTQSIEPDRYAPQASVKWCRNCSAELLASAKVCYKCGAPQGQDYSGIPND